MKAFWKKNSTQAPATSHWPRRRWRKKKLVSFILNFFSLGENLTRIPQQHHSGGFFVVPTVWIHEA